MFLTVICSRYLKFATQLNGKSDIIYTGQNAIRNILINYLNISSQKSISDIWNVLKANKYHNGLPYPSAFYSFSFNSFYLARLLMGR